MTKHLIMFAVPMFLGNLLQALYSTVDSIWVGRFLGPNALAAVSVSFPIIFALVALVMGLTMATTTLISQYYGAGRHGDVKRTVSNSILLLGIAGSAISIIGFLSRNWLLRLINVPDEIFGHASSYLGVYSLGLVAMFLYNAASAILRGLGDSRTPLKFLAYATVANIVLDPLFIFGAGPIPAMGVAGAALATVIAQSFSAAIGLIYLAKKMDMLKVDKSFWILDLQITKDTIRIGLPGGLQQTLVSLSSMVVGALVNSFGPTVVAGFGAAARIDQFSFMPAMSVSLAVSALVGQNMGAGRHDRVAWAVRSSMMISAGLTSIVSLTAILFPAALLSIFTTDPDVSRAGSEYLRIAALGYVPFALMFAFTGVLRGAGDTVATMFITLGSMWLVRVPLAAIMSRNPNLGIRGVWWAIFLSQVLGLAMNYAYYQSGRWKRFVIVREAASAAATKGDSDTEN